MRIVRHAPYIKSQKRKSQLLAIVGFLILSSAMFLAMLPNALLPAYIAMIGGFIMFNIGMQGVGRWTRNPRNDQIFDVRMKGLSDSTTLVHYAKLGDKVVDHIAVYPGGIMVLNGKEVDGKVQQRGPSWRKQGGLFRRLFSFSGPQIGNPSLENDRSLEIVNKWLQANQMELDVRAASVFLHPRVDLEIEDPDYPVLHGEELEDFFRDQEADETFTPDERTRVIELLSAGEGVEAPERTQASRRPRPVRRVAAPKEQKKAQAG